MQKNSQHIIPLCKKEEIEDYLLDLMDINIHEKNAVEISISKRKKLDILSEPINKLTYEYYMELDPDYISPILSCESIPTGSSSIRTITRRIETILPKKFTELYIYTVSIKCSNEYYSEIGKQFDLIKRVNIKLDTFLKRIGHDFINFGQKIDITKKFFIKNSLKFQIKLISKIDYKELIDFLEDDKYITKKILIYDISDIISTDWVNRYLSKYMSTKKERKEIYSNSFKKGKSRITFDSDIVDYPSY